MNDGWMSPEMEAKAWGWLEQYRRAAWLNHRWATVEGAPHFTWNEDVFNPSELDEPLRSAVKMLLESLPESWLERKLLTAYSTPLGG